MQSIVQDYYIPGDKFSEYIILAVLLILIIGTWTIILYFSSKGSTTVTGGITKAYLTCPATECPTLKSTGEKRCPTNEQLGLPYDPQFEVCNPPNSCEAFETPYAYNSDGSVNFNGQCEENSNCRCVNFLSTPSYIQSIFQVNGDSLYLSNLKGTSNTYITQKLSPYAGQGNNIPIIYNDFTTQFWSISPSLLYYLTPSPCTAKYATLAELTESDTLKCINENPCINGKMAYITANSREYINATLSGSSFTTSKYNLACVVDSVENTPTEYLSFALDSPTQAYTGTTLNGTLSKTGNTSTQTKITSGNRTNTTITIAQFLTESNILPSTNIPLGIWDLYLYAKSSEITSNDVELYARVFYVDADGTSNKTYISPVGAYTPITIQNKYRYTMVINATTLPSLSKRLGVEIVVKFTGANKNLELQFRNGTVPYMDTRIDALLKNTCLTSNGSQYAPFFNPMTGRVNCYKTSISQPN